MQKLIPNRATLVPSEAVCKFRGEIFDVYQWDQKLFDGSSATFEMLKRTDTAIAVCVVDDKVIVVNDEQPYFGSRQGFPGGRIDTNDADVEAAAAREVQEETGYSFANWRIIDVRQPYDKVEWFVYVVLGWGVSGQSEPCPDAGEKIAVELVSFDELKKRVRERAGSLGGVEALLTKLNNISDLHNLTPYEGQLVDR